MFDYHHTDKNQRWKDKAKKREKGLVRRRREAFDTNTFASALPSAFLGDNDSTEVYLAEERSELKVITMHSSQQIALEGSDTSRCRMKQTLDRERKETT